MLKWLETYATAVQAIAGIVSVAVTVALAVITYQYVRLTQRIVESSDAQLTLLRSSVNARTNTLAGLVTTMRILVDGLPDDERGADRMRTAAMWSGDNLAEFQRLASEHGRSVGERAAVVVPSLKWLRERVGDVKDEPELANWSEFPWQEWKEHRTRAHTELAAIWEALPSADESNFGKRKNDKRPERRA